MNLEEYKAWLEKNGNQEEAAAYEVARKIIRWHTQESYDYRIDLKPRFWYTTDEERLEYDLLIELEWESNRRYKRLIGVEFKDSDITKVVSQAVLRREYVDYMWIATNFAIPKVSTLLELVDSGIGWIIWDYDGFTKILIPASYNRRGHVMGLLSYLARREVEKAVKDLIRQGKVSQSIRSLFEFL